MWFMKTLLTSRCINPQEQATRCGYQRGNSHALFQLRQAVTYSLEYAHKFTLLNQTNDWSKHPYYNRIFDLRSA